MSSLYWKCTRRQRMASGTRKSGSAVWKWCGSSLSPKRRRIVGTYLGRREGGALQEKKVFLSDLARVSRFVAVLFTWQQQQAAVLCPPAEPPKKPQRQRSLLRDQTTAAEDYKKAQLASHEQKVGKSRTKSFSLSGDRPPIGLDFVQVSTKSGVRM